jgi:hypothetical protein
VQRQGCFHKIKLRGASYFGPQGHNYRSEFDSQNAAAHIALHTLLVSDNHDKYSLSQRFVSGKSSAKLFELVSRASTDQQNCLKRPASTVLGHEAGSSRKRISTDSNRLPISNCRFSPIGVPLEKEAPTRNLTPEEIIG